MDVWYKVILPQMTNYLQYKHHVRMRSVDKKTRNFLVNYHRNVFKYKREYVQDCPDYIILELIFIAKINYE